MSNDLSITNLNTKDTEDKLDWSLLPWEALEEVVRVREYGNKKYFPNSYLLTPNGREEYLKAAMRHIVDLLKGEQYASDSKLHHAAHAVTDLLIVMTFDALSPEQLLEAQNEIELRMKNARPRTSADLIEELLYSD